MTKHEKENYFPPDIFVVVFTPVKCAYITYQTNTNKS